VDANELADCRWQAFEAPDQADVDGFRVQ